MNKIFDSTAEWLSKKILAIHNRFVAPERLTFKEKLKILMVMIAFFSLFILIPVEIIKLTMTSFCIIAFIFWPLAKKISFENREKITVILIIIRSIFLFYYYFFVSKSIIDFEFSILIELMSLLAGLLFFTLGIILDLIKGVNKIKSDFKKIVLQSRGELREVIVFY